MNILFLSHRLPFPPDKGDKIRSFNEIKHLSRHHDIHLVAVLDSPSEVGHARYLQPFCKTVYAKYINKKAALLANLRARGPLTLKHFYSGCIQREVDGILETGSIGAVICYCSSMAEYVMRSRRYQKDRLSGVRLIMDFVDLDSDKWRQYADYTSSPLKYVYRMENRRLLEYEKLINRTFHHSVFVSPREVRIFKRLHPGAQNVNTISNGVDADFFSPSVNPGNEESGADRPPRLLFTGVMDYFANVDGVTWFARRIFPKIRQAVGEVEFYIVGNRPTDAVWALSEIEGITVTGYVSDIRQYYQAATVGVIPLRIARGLQNKVLEAMACARPVVATFNAADGIVFGDGHNILIADTEDAFAQQVIRLLVDPALRKRIGENGRANVIENYDWEKNLSGFDELLKISL